MKTVEKSVLIWFSPSQMFDLVTQVKLYPEFLPWCSHTRVLEESDSSMVAEVGMSIAGFKHSFTTRNTHVPNSRVEMSLVKGPFTNLNGEWRFTPVGDGQACKVDFKLQYGYDKSPLAAILVPVFDKVASTMVDAFVKRAEQVYGS